MKTVIVSSRKGGAGKTTLSLNLATEASQQGKRKVALVDLDPQGSSLFWASLRDRAYPSVVKGNPADVFLTLGELEDEGYDTVFLDMPPTDKKWIRESLGQADLVIIPTKPSPLDIHSATSTLEWAEEAGARVSWVINGASPISKNPDIVFELLKATRVPVFKTIVHERGDFVTSLSRGLSVSEAAPHSKAAAEIAELWREVKNTLSRS
ncbi:MAG TPA: ParA family protein [Limnobacter sp.]|uniref:ParA family protein n=1 Tax=Limnobacter sp. TaxID=2003368 RepID=UPI002EDAA9CC